MIILPDSKQERRINVKKFICELCGYEYDPEIGDPENGIEEGTEFEDLPEDWVCPLCGVGKDEFVFAEENETTVMSLE